MASQNNYAHAFSWILPGYAGHAHEKLHFDWLAASNTEDAHFQYQDTYAQDSVDATALSLRAPVMPSSSTSTPSTASQSDRANSNLDMDMTHFLGTPTFSEYTPPGTTPKSPTTASIVSTESPHVTIDSVDNLINHLSHGEYQIANAFLEWLRDPAPTPFPLKTVIANKGFRLVPLPNAVPGKKRKLSHVSAKHSGSRRQWWDRFLRFSTDDVALCLSQGDLHCIRQLDESAIDFDTPLQGEQPAAFVRDFADFHRKVVYAFNLEYDDFRVSVMQIVMRLFFFLNSQSKVGNPFLDTCASRFRVAKIRAENLSRLYMELKHQLPPHIKDEMHFKKQLQNWRVQGSHYAFLASRLGLGSLILLRHHIRNSWGCSKGGERFSVSDAAFDHLKAIGVPARAASSGADTLMHNLLWKACAELPEYSERIGNNPFPNFAYIETDAASEEDTPFEVDALSAGAASLEGNDAPLETEDTDNPLFVMGYE
ncbi:hypothetical protein ACN47E_003173 [Coniothyrium glycines]